MGVSSFTAWDGSKGRTSAITPEQYAKAAELSSANVFSEVRFLILPTGYTIVIYSDYDGYKIIMEDGSVADEDIVLQEHLY